MTTRHLRAIASIALPMLLVFATDAAAQRRPYIGCAYPAGGQQGTTFMVKVGGQGMNDLQDAIVSGQGVEAEVIEYHWNLTPQYSRLISEQINDLELTLPREASEAKGSADRRKMPEVIEEMIDKPQLAYTPWHGVEGDAAARRMIEKLRARNQEWVNRPAVSSIAEIAYLRVTIAPGAEPGMRDLRVMTPHGLSNPLVFCVGQLPETSRRPMRTAPFQVLGKEHLAQRKRPDSEVEMSITLPCTMNGQVASGETNEYRFAAKKGQRLVISSKARQLIPYIADAVPGWFQPVIALHDSAGTEIAYDDDFRFKPDPTLYVEIPRDGEYVLSIYDALYRGREDFIYRITIGELPFVTHVFPLGGRVGALPEIELDGWHLVGATIVPPSSDAAEGIHQIAAWKGKHKTNRVPFKLDSLPEILAKEPNDNPKTAQEVALPVIVNGRIESAGDEDVFAFRGKAGQTIVAEVEARRLDSPVDSMLRLTDAAGRVLFLNDDQPVMFDEGTDDRAMSLKAQGLTTHQADSYIRCELPADGTYFLYLSDTARNGGHDYGYRLRISGPRPDFELRIVPSSLAVRPGRDNWIRVFAIRKDGFEGPIRLSARGLPEGFTATSPTLSKDQTNTAIGLRTGRRDNAGLRVFDFKVVGKADTPRGEITRFAVPSEDRMQAFLWRHLVPAEEDSVKFTIFDPSYNPKPNRVPSLSTILDRE